MAEAHPASVVLSSLALKGVLESSQSAFEQVVGRLELRFDATQAILERLAQDARADLLILTSDALEELRRKGEVTQVRALGSSGVGLAVRAGAAKPDIGSTEALVRTLLAADSVAHSKVGASGIYFSELLESLGIAGKLKKRIVVEKGPVGLAVAAGEAEIGVQQLCELAPVRGIDIVGPLPPEIQETTIFTGGVCRAALRGEAAAALLAYFASTAASAAWRRYGLAPA